MKMQQCVFCSLNTLNLSSNIFPLRDNIILQNIIWIAYSFLPLLNSKSCVYRPAGKERSHSPSPCFEIVQKCLFLFSSVLLIKAFLNSNIQKMLEESAKIDVLAILNSQKLFRPPIIVGAKLRTLVNLIYIYSYFFTSSPTHLSESCLGGSGIAGLIQGKLYSSEVDF